MKKSELRELVAKWKDLKRMPIRPDVRVIGIEVAILIGLLLAGGFIEYYFIQSIQTDMPQI